MAVDSRQQKQSAFRGMQTSNAPPKRPRVRTTPAPQGAFTQMTAKDQAQALSRNAMQGYDPNPSTQAFDALPGEAKNQLTGGYTQGGFEGVVNSVGSDWYDLPEWQRTQILTGVRR